jgi:hypothetical protein
MAIDDLPSGYKERMDKEVLSLMPCVKRIMEICSEFCADNVEIGNDKIKVHLSWNTAS